MTSKRRRAWAWVRVTGFGLVATGAACGGAHAQTVEPGVTREKPAVTSSTQQALGPDAALLQALQANPVTGPYRFRVTPSTRAGQYVLSGRVGTRQVHDVAVRTAIALGVSVRDDLVIDTAEAYRAAAVRTAGLAPYVGAAGVFSSSYVYPPPLMGRLDEPFYGYEPPLVSYPYGWGAVTAREPLNLGALNAPAAPVAAPAPATNGSPNALPPAVELELDPLGVAVLRGKVPSLADRVAVGQTVARTRGVTQVINLLDIDPTVAVAARSDVPPPPPVPAVRPGRALPPAAPNADAPPAAEAAPIAIEGDALSKRVTEALSRRPPLAGLPVKVSTRDGVVTLTGRVPSAYEAMLAFRTAEQSPGVSRVVDRMEFTPPEAGGTNPLREKGRPEDVSAYLLAHARRQLGDLAHVERVEVRGDSLEVRGTVARADDRERVEAALRSIPLFRGYRLEATFLPD